MARHESKSGVRSLLQRLEERAAAASSPYCPSCTQAIATSDLNMSEGVGLCRACEKVFRLSEIVGAAERETLIADANEEPPDGAWAEDDGMRVRIGASYRSLPAALGMLFFALFWNGIVSVFLMLAAGSVLKLAGVQLPQSLPAPLRDGAGMGLGMTIFLCLFLTPFVVIGLFLIASIFMALGGRTDVTLDPGLSIAKIRTGFGPFVRTSTFDPSTVTSVTLQRKSISDGEGGRNTQHAIVIERDGGKPIRFGGTLPDARRRFVAGKLASVLTPR